MRLQSRPAEAWRTRCGARPARAALGFLALILGVGGQAAITMGATTTRVSVSSDESEASLPSVSPAISGDGRFVVFASESADLVSGDANLAQDIFIRDRRKGITRRVSVSSAEVEADDHSHAPAISGDGRFVVFESDATNLVADDDNARTDIFIRDRKLGVTRRMSVSSAEAEADNSSHDPAISADGRFVVFESDATNLVADDDNARTDIFIRDRAKGITRRVSVSSHEAEGDGNAGNPAVSGNGRFVAFESRATDLVADDDNGATDVFMRDRKLGITRRVSVRSNEAQANGHSGTPQLSATGRFVVFSSGAANLVADDDNGATDVFIRDRKLGTTRRVSVSSNEAEGDLASKWSGVSATGRYVVFDSWAGNLVDGDDLGKQDIFIRDRAKGTTRRISRGPLGEADGGSPDAAISADGRFVAFMSFATNLVESDGNGYADVFVRGPLR